MGRTGYRVLVTGSIAFLLVLTAVAGVVAPAVAGVVSPPVSPLPASPPAFAERTAPLLDEGGMGVRTAVELIVLALTCSVAVAFYSAMSGERGGTRVPARVRRR
jgi:hypothetical protein